MRLKRKKFCCKIENANLETAPDIAESLRRPVNAELNGTTFVTAKLRLKIRHTLSI